jgi:hypothetical protein
MNFFLTSDANTESGLGEILFGVNTALDKYFADRFYDDTGIAIAIVLMCRDPALHFKKRVRFSKKDKCLYMDIMLDLDVMTSMNAVERKLTVADRLLTEVPQVISKYNFKNFDLPRLSSDLRVWFEKQGWVAKELWPAEIE